MDAKPSAYRTAPMLRTGAAPYRSATAPANGWAAPHSSIWIASASANTSRPQPCALDIGVRKNPNPERAPKPMSAIRQPQARMTAGVRQDAGGRTTEGRRMLSASLPSPRWAVRSSIRGHPSSGRHGGRAHHRFFHDRQVDHRGEHAEQDRKPPYRVIGAGAHEHDAAEPHAEEAADLVAEEGQAGERREPTRAEYQRNDAVGRRDRGEPEQAHDRAEQDRRHRRHWKRDESEHRGGTGEIDEREDVTLGHEIAEPARGERADDVEQPDRRDGPGADLRRKAAVDEVGRHVDGDESELETAGEETEHEQDIGAVADRLRQRLP